MPRMHSGEMYTFPSFPLWSFTIFSNIHYNLFKTKHFSALIITAQVYFVFCYSTDIVPSTRCKNHWENRINDPLPPNNVVRMAGKKTITSISSILVVRAGGETGAC